MAISFDDGSRRVCVYDTRSDSGDCLNRSRMTVCDRVVAVETDRVGRVWVLTGERVLVLDERLQNLVMGVGIRGSGIARICVSKDKSWILVALATDDMLQIRVFKSDRGGVKQVWRTYHQEQNIIDWISISASELDSLNFFIGIATEKHDSVIAVSSNQIKLRKLSVFRLKAGIFLLL